MDFHGRSGLSQLQHGVAYAGVYLDRSTREPMGGTLRPVKVLTAGLVIVVDPMAESNEFKLENTGAQLQIVGRWDGPVYPLRHCPDGEGVPELAEGGMTWQGYAAQQLGQVLRHNELAARLTDFGIPREPEQYLPHRNISNAVQRSLVLTYDELEKLLDAVER